MIKSVVTGQAPVTLELRITLGENTNNPRWYTHISQLTQFMPPPETYESEIGSQSTMYLSIRDAAVGILLICLCFFPWGIPKLRSDWSLSCDHGLDYAS